MTTCPPKSIRCHNLHASLRTLFVKGRARGLPAGTTRRFLPGVLVTGPRPMGRMRCSSPPPGLQLLQKVLEGGREHPSPLRRHVLLPISLGLDVKCHLHNASLPWASRAIFSASRTPSGLHLGTQRRLTMLRVSDVGAKTSPSKCLIRGPPRSSHSKGEHPEMGVLLSKGALKCGTERSHPWQDVIKQNFSEKLRPCKSKGFSQNYCKNASQ